MSSVLNLSTLLFGRLPVGQGWALLYLRLIIGCAFVLHGVGKLQYGWCSWLGNELPAWVQGATTLIELVGGACLALGFMTPIVAVCIAAVMLGSILQFHLPRDHMFVLISGEGETWELNATYLTGCLVLATQGAGDFSCDGLVKRFFRHL